MTIPYVLKREQLKAFCAGADKYYDLMVELFAQYGIKTKLEVQHFLAQCAHESNRFTVLSENLNYSAVGLANTWPSRYAEKLPDGKYKKNGSDYVPNALAKKLQKNPQAIANNCYGGRLGNGPEATGEGWKHRGMGVKQVTGKDNQGRYSKWAYGDDRVVKNPEMLMLAPDCIKSAVWYWVTNDCAKHANRDDPRAVTLAINGGLIGSDDRNRNNLNDRVDWTIRAKQFIN